MLRWLPLLTAPPDATSPCAQFISFITLIYVTYCTYSTVFRIQLFNFFYLAPHHQTDPSSMLFAATCVSAPSVWRATCAVSADASRMLTCLLRMS